VPPADGTASEHRHPVVFAKHCPMNEALVTLESRS
jgi:hypothetical protein